MDFGALNSFIEEDNNVGGYDDLLELSEGGPVGEDMASEVMPEMSYFAEGGEIDLPPERGLFSQERQVRPLGRMPLKRTAAEMLQRMPQVPLGTMRFSPLSMPGVIGRQIPRFAAGGEVDAEQRRLISEQMGLGAPTENLFGANLGMPALPAPVSFETNIPAFTPNYSPPTGPVTTPDTAGALGQYPGLGVGTEFKYTPVLYDKLSPTTLSEPATTFSTTTGYTPTAQTTTTPKALTREEAMLKQPTLVRYEPDVKFGGLTTYTGPLQPSPYMGGDSTTKPDETKRPALPVDSFALLGFRAPTEGVVGGESKYWFNPSMGYIKVPGGYTPQEGSGWTEVGSEDFLNPRKPEVPINFTDTDFFVTDNYKTPLDQPRVSNLTDVFRLIAGSDVSGAAQNLFKNPTYGWVPDPTNPAGGTFNMTPGAVNNIRSSEPFKNAVSDTVKKIYNELGYTVGGEKTTATNVSDKDVATWANAISAGQTDIFRVANTITSPMRMSGQLQLTPDRPTLTSIYVNSGLTIPGHLNKTQIDAAYQKVLGRPADNAGLLYYAADPSVKGRVANVSALEAVLSNSREGQVQAAYRQSLGRAADPAGLAYYTSGEGRNVDLAAYLPTSREAQVRQAYQQVLGRAADTPGLQFYTSGAGSSIPIADLRTMFDRGERPPAARYRGSPPEGEYADPVAGLRERLRMRRESGLMDQGTARDRLKKFLGGEDLTPVRMAEGGEADKTAEAKARDLYAQIKRSGDAVDEAGLKYWTERVQRGQQSPEDLQKEFLAAADIADDPYFEVNRLYQRVGQTPDTEGFNYWVNRAMQDKLSQQKLGEQFIGGLPAITEAQQRPGFGLGGQYGTYNGLPMLYAPEVDRVLSGRQRVEGDVVNLDNAIGWDPASISGEISRGASSTGVYRMPGILGKPTQYVGDLAGVARQYGIDPAQYTRTLSNQYGMQSTVVDEEALYNALDEKLKDYYAVQGYVPPAGTENSAFNRTDIGGDHARVMYQRVGDRLVPIEQSLQYSNMQRAPKYSLTDYLAPAAIIAAPFALPYIAPYFSAAGVAKGAALGAGKNILQGKDPFKGGAEGALTSFIPSPFAKGGEVKDGGPVQAFGKGGAVIEDVELFNEGGLVRGKNTGGLYQEPVEPTFGQRMGAKASDLITKGLINLVDVADVPGAFDKSKMSAAHKIYLDSFGLKENRGPITKDYFNQEELQALVDLIEKKGGTKGSITYEDYKRIDKLAPERKVKQSELLAGLLPPRMSVSKALGQFNYELDPRTNQYRIIDEYDFNPKELEGIKALSNSDFIGDYIAEYADPVAGFNPFDVYTLARIYGGRKMPPGTGRKVDLSVPATTPVKRKDGSPEYGEIAIGEGGVTKDTLRGLRSGKGTDTFLSDSAKMLRNVFGEGVSNLESRIRGSLATIPGSFGDIESIFRESDKTRKLATTEEVLRDYMPRRLTKPTKEAAGFEEVGTYLPLAIPAGTVSKAAGAVKTGARKALEELGPTAGEILERAVPKFGIVPEGPAAPTNLSQRVEQGKYFSGRLDNFISQIRNPVTKQQFLGSLKGKFRDYEIGRAAQALADLDDAAKITPTDLVSRINAVATPNRYKTTFIEPKDSGLHNRFDNVYGATGQPVGVINLSYEPTKAAVEAEEASAAARSAAAALGRGTTDTEKIKTLTSFLDTSEELAKSPEEKTRLVTGLNNLEMQLAAAQGEADIVLKELNDIRYLNVPEVKNWYPTVSERRKAIPKSLPLDSEEYISLWKAADDQTTNEIKVQALRRVIQENPVVKSVLDRFAKEEFSPAYKSVEEMLQDTGPNYVVNDVLPYVERVIKSTAKDSTNAILVDNKALLDDILKQTQKYSTYKGSHAAVNPEKNAMGFSRYTEHQVNVPGMGKLDGIYVSELQSDMFRDIKKLGKKGGSAAKDKQELSSLFDSVKSRLDPLRSQIEDRFGSMDSFMFVMRGDMTGKADPTEFSNFLTTLGPISKGKADQIAADTVKDIKRITKLQERLGLPGGQVKGTYDIEEPIANIETQPQVVQQLLAKNAIVGAMQMGKSFVAFPGTESQKAQLYEKLPNNLKAVIKDLGEGFVTQPITIRDATGVDRTHLAVIWDKNAAQRVLNNGVPFKKGGLVEKSALNNRRYI